MDKNNPADLHAAKGHEHVCMPKHHASLHTRWHRYKICGRMHAKLIFLQSLISGCACTCLITVPAYAVCSLSSAVTAIKPWSAEENKRLGSVSAIDAYSENEKVHVLVAGTTDKSAIFYLHTVDDDHHWSPAIKLPIDTGNLLSRRGNDVQIAAHGRYIVALWQTQGELPGMGPIFAVQSDDNGKTWHRGVNPADSQVTDQSHMDLIADEQGHFHLLWLDDRQELGNYQGLRYARSDDYGRCWQHNATLDESTCTCCWTRLAAAPDKHLYALYRDGSPHDMRLSTSSDAGLHWQKQGPVGVFNWEFQGCPHTGGGLAISPDGNLFSLVWTGQQGYTGLHFMHSVDAGKTWSHRIMPDANALHADIASVGTNALLALWDSRSMDRSSVYAAESCNLGTQWSEPKLQSNPDYTASHPRVVATRRGIFGFWTERLPNGHSQLAFYR